MIIGVQVVDTSGSGLSTVVPLDTDYVSSSPDDIIAECSKQFVLLSKHSNLPFSSISVPDIEEVQCRVNAAHNSLMPF